MAIEEAVIIVEGAEMTCIVGAVQNGTVIFGGDSQIICGTSKRTEIHPKVWINRKFVIGSAGWLRDQQVLRFCFSPPSMRRVANNDLSLYRYMVSKFIPAMKKLFKKEGILHIKNEIDSCYSSFLIGTQGCIFHISNNFTVSLSKTYDAIGSGAKVARGVMEASSLENDAEERIRRSIEISAKLCTGIGGPITIIRT